MASGFGFVFAIDKPLQWTSFQVVNKLKWHLKRTFGIKKIKIGHAGTLDPMASGLLLVCVGSATKQIEQLQSGVKEYSGTMVLGATTPCYDLEQAIDAYYPTDHITPELIETVRRRFVGNIEQVPPIFSAVKVDGQRAYSSARKGEQTEIKSRTVTVYDFVITDFRAGNAKNVQRVADSIEPTTDSVELKNLYLNPLGSVPDWLPQLDFRLVCSKGTYIRSIARDMGLEIGSGAFLSALRRERVGDYTLANSIKLEDFEKYINRDNPLLRPLAEGTLGGLSNGEQ